VLPDIVGTAALSADSIKQRVILSANLLRFRRIPGLISV
jgi:hypothetical protein